MIVRVLNTSSNVLSLAQKSLSKGESHDYELADSAWYEGTGTAVEIALASAIKAFLENHFVSVTVLSTSTENVIVDGSITVPVASVARDLQLVDTYDGKTYRVTCTSGELSATLVS